MIKLINARGCADMTVARFYLPLSIPNYLGTLQIDYIHKIS